MPDQMLQFTQLPQEQPNKRAVTERRADFAEIYRKFETRKAAAQSSRCSQCGIPFCSIHCPVANNIPDWLKLTAEGRLQEAYELSSATNTIGAVERFITDTAFEEGWVQPITAPFERRQSVGIIGAGPAGLAAAEGLRSRGYQVTVYDRHDRVGGLMIYGIPGFKLEKEIVMRRWRWLAEGGIKFELNADIGGGLPFAELRARHDAILVATGVYKPREIAGPGAGLPGIVPALDFLITSNRKGLGDAVPDFDSGLLNARGKDVVVIGGGDTAMDCVRTAVRQEAKSVTCLYRRDKQNMPGSLREVSNAEDEGVVFTWLAAPEAFLGENTVSGVRATRMHLGLPDASGRQSVEPIAGSSFTLSADLVIKALGFDPEDIPGAFSEPALALTGWGTLKVDTRTGMTSLPGVFAAGDIVRGASLVVWAIRDGREAAVAIDRYIEAQQFAVAAE